ncbi:MAG: Z1 domain-containing protein [Dehalococcoidia bacterium]|nr:Z1 domain-containing protein [Dehalococcoidia bacterium]
MSENLGNLETAVGSFLAKDVNPTPERIRELIQTFRVLPTCDVDDATAEALARRFEARHSVTMTIGSVLTERGHEPWLDAARSEIDPYYWDRYRKLLAEQGLSSQVMATLDDVTDRILGLMENPAKGDSWDRRGMVVGHVQSGKTANYIGLMCKAADAGYKLIVVIAGIQNNLRNQTQLRIDEGFVGRDSARLLSKKGERFVGVGRFDRSRRPVTFTNSVRDFNKAMATGVGIPLQSLTEPAVFVIKKNSSTLKNLLEWLTEHSARSGGTVDAPMLLIDDEADNASINISHGSGEVSKINGQLRALLQTFERSCYVGYTATPFANIFIDPDTDDEMMGHDLFPRHFILSLDPPSNYFGANRVLIDHPEDFIRYIEDNEDWLPLKHTKETQIRSLPPSLKDAVRTFIVARAIRLTRGHENAHCSMLVNVSRFTNVQKQIRNEIHTMLDLVQASLRVNGALPPDGALRDPEIAALHRMWQTEFSGTSCEWPDIQQHLHTAAAPIRVVEVNSNSSGTLNYADHEKTGLNVIAVGGFSLSRGLTLEGLTVSYFLRNSMMYDTLMQMGRWFGYRPNYDDLCRIWMPEEAEGWYAHIAESIEMLREELRSMEAVGATPEEFGLKVRSHPDTLVVTARNKLGSGRRIVVNIGLGNSFIETAFLRRDATSLHANRTAAQTLASQLSEAGHPLSAAEEVSGGWLVRGVPAGPVLDFIGRFQNHPGAMLTDPGPVRRYIEDRQDSELAAWDVLFTSTRGGDDALVDTSLSIAINCQRRSAGRASDAGTLRITNKQRVASRGVEKTGLTPDEIAAAESRYRAEREAEGRAPVGETINYPDRIYRFERQRPLLIVHLLKIAPGAQGDERKQAVVAYGISFPRTEKEEKRVEYVVNTTWLRENFPEDFEDDELTDDDGDA